MIDRYHFHKVLALSAAPQYDDGQFIHGASFERK
jgi:hypothetical protein